MGEAYEDGEFDENLDHSDDGQLPDNEPDPITDEQRAMAQGWKPKHLYRGPPEKWTDAATYLAHGEAEWPVLRDQNRRMTERLVRTDEKITALQNTVAEQAQAVKDAIALARRSNEAGYNRALAELKAEQRAAVEAGDTQAFDQVEQQITALQETRAEVEAAPPPAREPPPPAAPAAQPMTPAVQTFIATNASWFNDASRPTLRNMMIAFHNEVIAEQQIVDVGAQLEEAKARLAERYPDQPEFAGAAEPMPDLPPRRPPAARTAAPVAAPRGGVPSGQLRQPAGRSPFDQIPDANERKEAREAFARVQRQDPDLTAGEYVAMYLDPHADVLALRKTHRK